MSAYKKIKKIFSLLFLTIFVSGSFAFPQNSSAATSGAASIDCEQVAAIGAAITSGIAAYIGEGQVEMGITSVSVPIQNKILERTSIDAGAQTTGGTTWQTIFKGLGDCIMYKTAQIMLDNLTDQTINWIKSGMNGSPYYALDPKQLEADLTDAVAGNFINQIKSLELCDFTSSFKNDLANWLIVGSTGENDLKRQTTLACPFNTNISASEFYSGTQAFTWQYFETALNDSGNPFGVSVIAQNELTRQQAEESARAKQQLDWGQGFLSVIDETDCNYPASVLEWMNSAEAQSSPAAVQAYQRSYCKKVTPAQLVESRLTKATDVEWDRIGLADSLSKIINTLITKVSNDAIQGIFKE